MTSRYLLSSILLASLASYAVAFASHPTMSRTTVAPLSAHKIQQPVEQKLAAVAAIVAANVPMLAQAVEDDYEYGKVDAPIGLAFGVGLLAIATAAIPVLLRPGEEALEKQRENEGGTFGKGKDVLKK